MEIKDALISKLEGEALELATGFVDYLTSKGLTAQREWGDGYRFVMNERSPCLLVFLPQDNGWFVCDLPVATEPEWAAISEDLQEFIVSHIKTCNVHEGNPCGCGSEPGLTKTIFGKSYQSICTSEIQLVYPTAEVLAKLLQVMDWWLANIGTA